jgi:hypothetical protein
MCASRSPGSTAAGNIRSAADGIKARPGILCVFAPWRETEESVMTENAIAKEIVDAAFRIYTTLGPGLLESVYDILRQSIRSSY